jgi:Flp pilus assembly protein TadG
MNRFQRGLARHPTRRRDKRERGQALVEFAVAAPVMLIVIVGLFDVGRLVYINNELSHAAREGARWGAVQGRAADQAAGTNTGVTDAVNAGIVVAPGTNVTVACSDVGAGTTTCASGDLLTVNVSAAVAPITPLIGDVIGPLVLSSEAQMTIH